MTEPVPLRSIAAIPPAPTAQPESPLQRAKRHKAEMDQANRAVWDAAVEACANAAAALRAVGQLDAFAHHAVEGSPRLAADIEARVKSMGGVVR